jgi:hypothetical protein
VLCVRVLAPREGLRGAVLVGEVLQNDSVADGGVPLNGFKRLTW